MEIFHTESTPALEKTHAILLDTVHYFEGQYEDAVRVLIGEALLNSLAHAFLVGAYAHLGRDGEARVQASA